MKKTFLVKRNALLSSSDLSWGIFALGFAIVALLLRILAPNAFLYTFAPVFGAADGLSAKSHEIFSSFGDTAALVIENDALKDANAALANENQMLLERVEAQGALSGTGIIAGVIARPPTSPYDTLVLSEGANAGVVLGMEAFGQGGVPLGVVSEVLADFSRVTLFSSPNISIEGWLGRKMLPVTLHGAGAGALRADIARLAGANVGDTVYVPGPGALPIAAITRIDSDSSSPVATLYVQGTLNPFSVTWVELRSTGAAFAESLVWKEGQTP